MSLFSDLTIKSKLRGVLLISTLGLAAVFGLSLWVLHRYKVNGPVYEHLKDRMTIRIEMEPPTFLVAEPYLILYELISATDHKEIEKFKKQFAEHEGQFREREAYWSDNLIESPIKRALVDGVFPSAHDFYRSAWEDFMPLVGNGERLQMLQLVTTKIRPLYVIQRQHVVHAIDIAAEMNQNEENTASENTRFWFTAMVVISIATVMATALGGWWTVRGIVGATGFLLGRVQDIAAGASDLTARVPVESRDEMGLLAEGFNATISKIQAVVRRIREASVQLLSTAAEIAAAARQQETSVQTLGSSTAEIAASVRQISATSKELSTTMNDVSDRAGRVASLADAGRGRLENMETAVKQLVTATSSVSDKLSVIRDKADGINVVVTTITKVADQTNLLSINAAIEAEKAGEYGRGFLVVAREIRRLADQTAVATLDIENMVRLMQDAVSAGVMQMDKFNEDVRQGVTRVAELGEQMGQIIEEVHALSDRFSQVNEGVRNQSLGAQQINDAMTQVMTVAQQTRDSIEEFKRATEHQRNSVDSINQEVNQFKV
ncbi:MAG TPA: methyl-accepting chemotaxis protein [Gemmataceae bacterium]|jgi:methyl-accepting chemotaxis protein WspA